jgi:hypothetical protein
MRRLYDEFGHWITLTNPAVPAIRFAFTLHFAKLLVTSRCPRLRRNTYVSVSRASYDAQIYTNDATTLAQGLSRNVSKSSALDLPTVKHETSEALVQPPCIKGYWGCGFWVIS